MKTMIASLSLLAFVSVAWGGSGFPYQVANTEEINAINLSDLKRSASNRYTFSANYIAGNITVGHSGVLNYRFVNYNFAPEATEIMGTLSISGSPDFALTSDACSGVTLNPGQSCLVQVTFTPSSKSTMQAALSIPWDTYGTDPSLPWYYEFFGLWTRPAARGRMSCIGLHYQCRKANPRRRNSPHGNRLRFVLYELKSGRVYFDDSPISISGMV